jgi:hypothetical protein
MSSSATCQICGVVLVDSYRQLQGVCAAAKCQLAWASRLQAKRNAELQLQKQKQAQLAQAYQQQEAARRGINLDPSLQPAVVPANFRKIVNLPERRKRTFRDNLLELISQAAVARAKSADPPRGETAADSSPPPPKLASQLGRGCATCQGRCCTNGGNHAYLSVDTILGFMHNHPKLRPREVLQAYLEHLPNRAFEDSCVYHAKNGCTLPREMRAKISGDFFCEELRQFEKQFYAEGERKVIFYAIEENEIIRFEPLPEVAGEPI